MKILSDEKDTEQSSFTRVGLHSSSGNFQDEAFLIPLFKCLVALQCEEQLTALIQAVSSQLNRYPIVETLASVCDSLYKSLIEGGWEGEPLQQLLSYCISSLEYLLVVV